MNLFFLSPNSFNSSINLFLKRKKPTSLENHQGKKNELTNKEDRSDNHPTEKSNIKIFIQK